MCAGMLSYVLLDATFMAFNFFRPIQLHLSQTEFLRGRGRSGSPCLGHRNEFRCKRSQLKLTNSLASAFVHLKLQRLEREEKFYIFIFVNMGNPKEHTKPSSCQHRREDWRQVFSLDQRIIDQRIRALIQFFKLQRDGMT